MKTFTLLFSIFWVISIIVILYFKVTFWGLDANNLSLILTAIFGVLTAIMYFYTSNQSKFLKVKQTATADNRSTIIQAGRDYKEK
ncbi:hypothetical protein QDR31_08220 [Acinetobacter baumannii]|uniref:hypothetical protein n=1 Tax=Acinetobacter baumannii TaxID=470 RepID=UPI002340D96E|nr:hypothetical protein [Acinetobacter baumannii]MDC4518534.1 hypothetical protein [Acinetobacter baumannii]MDH2495071.1 hypothetical protein [Acinetobacter baumannii]MDH2515106.1 hypothetical protein [Acinetobacter baumannii]